jgi:hypothetical protein
VGRAPLALCEGCLLLNIVSRRDCETGLCLHGRLVTSPGPNIEVVRSCWGLAMHSRASGRMSEGDRVEALTYLTGLRSKPSIRNEK